MKVFSIYGRLIIHRLINVVWELYNISVWMSFWFGVYFGEIILN